MKKTFYHVIPNSCIHVMVGDAHSQPFYFYGGQLELDDEKPEEALAMAELNKIANKPGSPVSTTDDGHDTDAEAAAEAVKQNAAHVAALLAAQRARTGG